MLIIKTALKISSKFQLDQHKITTSKPLSINHATNSTKFSFFGHQVAPHLSINAANGRSPIKVLTGTNNSEKKSKAKKLEGNIETRDPLFLAKHGMSRKIRTFRRCPHLQCRKASRHTQETWLIGDWVCCQNASHFLSPLSHTEIGEESVCFSFLQQRENGMWSICFF